MRALAMVLLLFGTGYASTSPINHLARAETDSAAYLYQLPGYRPTISGDGSTIVAPTGSAIWLWRPGQQAQTIIKIPAGYHSGDIAVSPNGKTVAGWLDPGGEQSYPQVFYPGRNNRPFLWHAGGRVEMLPEIPPTDHLGGIQVNDTGDKIFFGCVDNHSVPGLVVACNDGPFEGSKNLPDLKQWTLAHGYQNITLPNGNSENLLNIAGDFQSYLMAYASPGEGCGTVLMTNDGKEFPIPPPFAYRPCRTLYTDVDNKYFVQEPPPSSSALIVWDAKGREVGLRKPLPGCSFGLITAIDDLGNIYAQEQCFDGKSVWTEGVRVTASGTETLKHWLEAAGVGSSLPLDLIVDSVSANGETIYGDEFNGVAIGSSLPHTPTKSPIVPDAPPGSRFGFEQGVPFIAHVPSADD